MPRSNRAATARPSKAVQKAEESEIDYEVERIVEHDRKKSGLRYKVAWMGYPLPEDDTWQPEDSLESAPEIVEAYWETVPDKKKHERYVAGSKKAKEAIALASSPAKVTSTKSRSPSVAKNGATAAAASTPVVAPVNGSRKRVASESLASKAKKGKKVKEPSPEVEVEAEEEEAEEEEVVEEVVEEKIEEEEEVVEEKKEDKIEVEEEEEEEVVEKVEKVEKKVVPVKKGKKEVQKVPVKVEVEKVIEKVAEKEEEKEEEEIVPAVVEEEEDEEEVAANVMSQVEAIVKELDEIDEIEEEEEKKVVEGSPELSGEIAPHPFEIKYAKEKSWENRIDEVDTMARGPENSLLFSVVWSADKSTCMIPLETAREKFPQKIIDLFVAKVQFKVLADEEEEEEGEGEEENDEE